MSQAPRPPERLRHLSWAGILGGALASCSSPAPAGSAAADAGARAPDTAGATALAPLERVTRLAGSPVRSAPSRARVSLGDRATEPLMIEDPASGVSVAVALEGASPVAAVVADGARAFPDALPGAELVRVSTAAGAEDLVVFDSPPPSAELRFAITLGERVAGLRLVGGVLELLDAEGAPRLRASRPWVGQLAGGVPRREPARLELRGCRASTDPAAPWGRATTPSGGRSCTLAVTWDASIARGPLVVDPLWELTSSMAFPRHGHSATPLAYDTLVLVVGGTDTPGSPAELFDTATTTWAVTSVPVEERRRHAAVAMGQGAVALIGGEFGAALTATTETYTRSTGQFTPGGALSAPRAGMVAISPWRDDRILVLGGRDVSGPVAIVERSQGAAAWTVDTPLLMAREGHAAIARDSSEVGQRPFWLVGGRTATGLTATVETYLPAIAGASTTTAAPSLLAPRASHAGVVRRVPVSTWTEEWAYVIGGEGPGGPLSTLERFEEDGTGWVLDSGVLAEARTEPLIPSTTTPSTWLPVLGGRRADGSVPVAVEGLEFLQFGVRVTRAGELRTPRSEAVAMTWAPPSSGGARQPVIAGGKDPSGATLASVELLPWGEAGACASFAGDCASDSECATGPCLDGRCCQAFTPGRPCEGDLECATTSGSRCVDGYCCNRDCTGQCEACDVAGRFGYCSAVAGTPHGQRAACAATSDPSCAPTCDGMDALACHPIPAGTSCGAPQCAGDAVRQRSCSGTGECIDAPLADTCAPFGCEGGACRTSCSADTDCALGFTCRGDACRTSSLPTCDGQHTLVAVDDTVIEDCRPYACPYGATACETSCESDQDCRGEGTTCAPDGTCRVKVGTKPGGCGVAVGPDSERRASTWTTALALLLGLMGARRRAAR